MSFKLIILPILFLSCWGYSQDKYLKYSSLEYIDTNYQEAFGTVSINLKTCKFSINDSILILEKINVIDSTFCYQDNDTFNIIEVLNPNEYLIYKKPPKWAVYFSGKNGYFSKRLRILFRTSKAQIFSYQQENAKGNLIAEFLGGSIENILVLFMERGTLPSITTKDIELFENSKNTEADRLRLVVSKLIVRWNININKTCELHYNLNLYDNYLVKKEFIKSIFQEEIDFGEDIFDTDDYYQIILSHYLTNGPIPKELNNLLIENSECIQKCINRYK